MEDKNKIGIWKIIGLLLLIFTFLFVGLSYMVAKNNVSGADSTTASRGVINK